MRPVAAAARFPYTTLFRSGLGVAEAAVDPVLDLVQRRAGRGDHPVERAGDGLAVVQGLRSDRERGDGVGDEDGAGGVDGGAVGYWLDEEMGRAGRVCASVPGCVILLCGL